MSNPKIVSYCLVEEKDIKIFNKNVCELIGYGYQPHNSIIISRELSGSIYSQVMVKYEHLGFGSTSTLPSTFGSTSFGSSSGFGSTSFGSSSGFGSSSSESGFGSTAVIGSTRQFGFV